MKKLTISTVTLILAFIIFPAKSQTFFCPGNHFNNGDFSLGTPTPGDQDINLADFWYAIWSGPGGQSLADFYDDAHAGTGAPPTPTSGNYASMWIDNRLLPGVATWREGMLNRLTIELQQDRVYTFSFKMACLGGFGTPTEVGIYAIRDPDGLPYSEADPPTGSHVPTNLNLFSASGVNQQIALLGTVPVPALINSQWDPHVNFTFSTAGLGLSGNITHIAIMRSANVIPSGSRYVAFDDFCLQEDTNAYHGDYCCDTVSNPIRNGNFEVGNTGFTSQYTYDGSYTASSIMPGMYTVGTSTDANTICSSWNVSDHSSCAGFPNDKMLLVNGRTQSTNPLNTVWEQDVTGLQTDTCYVFCGYFKHLSTCCFDVPPKVFFEIQGKNTATTTITKVDECGYQRISGAFKATSNSANIKIRLIHNSVGDGGDLAIDDLALFKQSADCTPGALITQVSTVPVSDPVTPDGSVTVRVIGGVCPFSFVWSTGHITDNVTGLPAGTYHVTVTDGAGTIAVDSGVVDGPPVCGIPDPISTTDLTSHSAKLNWTPVSGASSYRINGGIMGGPQITVDKPGGPSSFLSATGLSPAVTYTWKVRSYCPGIGFSQFSAVDTFTTPSCPAPDSLFTSNITSTSAKFNWTPEPGASGYVINGGVLGGPPIAVNVGGGASSFQANGLAANTSYNWNVLTECGPGAFSPGSPVQTFTTLPGPSLKSQGTGLFHGATSEFDPVIYPNPTSGQTTIQFKGPRVGSAKIRLIDLRGKTVYQDDLTISGDHVSVELGHLSSGIYRVVISVGDAIKVRKLVISQPPGDF